MPAGYYPDIGTAITNQFVPMRNVIKDTSANRANTTAVQAGGGQPALWFETDTLRLWYSDGTVWVELAFAEILNGTSPVGAVAARGSTLVAAPTGLPANGMFIGDIGSGGFAFFGIAHAAQATPTNYALNQSSAGLTQVNAASGQTVSLAINNAAKLTVKSTGDVGVMTAGNGLQVKEGSNAKQGTATLAAGTVTVSNTSVTANSRIMLTAQDNNTAGALRVSARTAGTSFVITSSNGADTGVVAYQIFEPA